jgi:hypothetical protein
VDEADALVPVGYFVGQELCVVALGVRARQLVSLRFPRPSRALESPMQKCAAWPMHKGAKELIISQCVDEVVLKCADVAAEVGAIRRSP